eukprot:TRINITY_DN2140_c0_g2_i1.p1 TRINITY_DN2140_c0_g2~~TRINITY_DN2140_c0_g2_i1.p1  ORF type:complete len:603 (+),score=210.53 TRINITY_DN2140_c0_g2_i1:52-1809(+)
MLGLAVTAAAAAAAGARPNIVMIVMDDLGWDDVGFRSHQIRTPHIDQLAKDGVVLDRYYTQDVCSPARATFMTGRYPMHHGIVDWIPPASAYGLPTNETTVANLLNRSGYDTHAVGKWHLGLYKESLTPTFRGFRSFYGFYGGGEDYFKHVSGGAFDWHRDPEPYCNASCRQIPAQDAGGYSTQLFSAEAVRVVQQHNTSKPLFLYLAYQAVHSPAEVPSSYSDAYNTTISDKKRRTFAGMLSCADEGIGNVTAALRARGMMDNTVIVFTTDNGGPTTTGDGVGARNWPLRGGKHSIWEGGTRATGFIWGPGAGVAGGGVYSGLMHGADWLPTICDAAGASTSGTLPLDGVSQWAQLQAPASAKSPRDGFVYGNSTNDCQWHPVLGKLQCGFGIRHEQWKLVRGYGGGPDTWCNTSASGPVCATPGATTSASSCNVTEGVCYPSNDIRSFATNSTADCCAACDADGSCVGWTLNRGRQGGPMCYLKHALAHADGCTGESGAKSGVPPAPAHSCPGGHCLYDVLADPSEVSEVGAENPEVLSDMVQRLDALLASGYHEYQKDPNCKTVVYIKDPSVPTGKVWAPWC